MRSQVAIVGLATLAVGLSVLAQESRTTRPQLSISGARVAWLQDWLPANIAWESELIAYRVYSGQFDFFGKSSPRLVLHTLQKGDERYHKQLDWGMDVLLVGSSSGIGGLTLYVNGTAYPVRNPAGKGDPVFDKRLVSMDETRVMIETTARGVGPRDNPFAVRLRCTALAGRQDSPIEALVEGGRPQDRLELGIGLTKLKEEALLTDKDAGILGAWGTQSPEIGTIGMGVLFPLRRWVRFTTLADENQVVLRIERGVPIVYHIRGDWPRGRCPDCRPPASDWFDQLHVLAGKLNLD